MSGKRKTTRRQFLKGESAIDALDDMTFGTVPEPRVAKRSTLGPPQQTAANADSRHECTDPAEFDRGTYLLEFSRQAMACQFAVFLNAGQFPDAAERAFEALDLVDQLEGQMTVYREESEISRLNRTAAEYPFLVESRLYDLLRLAQQLNAETGGAFDVSSGPLSKVWGFYRRQGQLPSESALHQARQLVGGRWLELDDEHQMVSLAKPGVEINLGGIGKGYALDRCVEFLESSAIHDFAIHGGQSSIAARGSRLGGEADVDGWKVGVNHPVRPEQRLAEITLRNQALGTSGSRRQSFYHQGKRYGHIIDPRSGQPADGIYSATVVAPTAAVADALSTAFYVMGLVDTLDYCQRHPEIGALIVTPAKRSGSIEIHSIGLPDSDCRLLTQK